MPNPSEIHDVHTLGFDTSLNRVVLRGPQGLVYNIQNLIQSRQVVFVDPLFFGAVSLFGSAMIRSVATGIGDNGGRGDGNLYIRASDYNSTDYNGRRVVIEGGDGNPAQTSSGGNVEIYSGDGSESGGQLILTAGQGDTVAGGAVTISSGDGDSGGTTSIFGGQGDTAGGGDVSLSAGNGATTGGNINLTAGPGNSGNGGSIAFVSGQPIGAGAIGKYDFYGRTGGVHGYLDFESLATSDKTYTFPNVSGVIQVSPTNQTLAATTYTPTLFNVANLDGSTAFVSQYLRVGNVVHVSGKVLIDPTTTATSTQLGISLPIASALSAQEQCAGTAFASGITGMGAAILGDAANDRAQLQFICTDTTSQPMYYTFTYLIQ